MTSFSCPDNRRRVVAASMFVIILVLTGSVLVQARDYTTMTMQELAMVKGAMPNALPGEQEAFRAEWEKRLAAMSDEQRQQLEELERSGRFPNPYVQGRGYDNQGVNWALFEVEGSDTGGDGEAAK